MEQLAGDFLQHVMDQIRDAIWIVDEAGRIISVNQAAEDCYGYSCNDIKTMRVHDFRLPEATDEVEEQLKKAHAEGILFRTLHRRRSGEIFPVEIRSQSLRHADRTLAVSVIRDISKRLVMEAELQNNAEELQAAYDELLSSDQRIRRQLEELLDKERQIERQNLVLTLVNQMAVDLMHRRDLEEVLERVARSAAELLNTPNVYISLVNKPEGALERKVALGDFASDGMDRIPLGVGVIGIACDTGDVAMVDDYSQFDGRVFSPHNLHLKCLAAIPLKADARIIGAIVVAFADPGRLLTEEETELLRRIAEIASMAIDDALMVRSYQRELAERRRAEEAARAAETKYRTIFNTVADGINIHDAATGKILDLNEKAAEMLGYRCQEMLGSELECFEANARPFSAADAKEKIHRAARGEPQVFEWQGRRKDGSSLWTEVRLQKTCIGGDECVLSVVRDISERKGQEETIRRMAYQDLLTGLPNQARLKEYLTEEMARVKNSETGGAVLFIDIDEFKAVNDNFGHTYGDEIIRQLGADIAGQLGEDSLVSRLGGDEFIAVLAGREDRRRVETLAAGLVERIRRYYDLGLCLLPISASIGIALYPQDGDSAEELLKNADMALYEAKRRGKNMWQFFDAEQQQEIYANMLLKQGLREAINRNEMTLVFQPLVDAKTAEIVGFEALLRWNSRDFGAVAPDKFIPLAEESGVIRPIGEWVIRNACAFAGRLRRMGREDLRVAINISARQLAAENFITILLGEILAAGIDTKQLELEITETALIDSMGDSIAKLEYLRAADIHLALDDFGKGYSSLSYLKDLPVGTVKIDKEFIEDIADDPRRRRFMHSVIQMAHGQNLHVTAEGVETLEQYEILRQCQCDYLQGYLFSRPVALEDAVTLLRSGGETRR